MQIITKKLSELHPYANNPRKNDQAVDAVANSIREFGFKVPIVIDKNGEIIAGHTRYKAAKKLKLKEIPCIIADDLTEEQIKAFRLADNKVGELAEWDFEALNIELDGITDIDMEQFGFDLDVSEEEKEVIEDDFNIAPPEEPVAKYGQVYRLGRHRLMCGDSTDSECVKKLVCGVQLDLFLTDPPYNVDYDAKEQSLAKVRPNKRVQENINTGIENDRMQDNEFRDFLKKAFQNACENMKKGAAFYIWHADSEGYNFRGACKDSDLEVKQCLIWEKQHISLGRQDYQWIHEPCLYGWKKGASHKWYSDRKQTTVLKFEKPNRSELHPTMKPIALFDYLIKNSTKEGDIVLDLFGGSGTTIMACEQDGRTGYVMEYDPKYVDVIIKRWEEFTGRKAELINDNRRSTENH